jgi:hypothetical protein
MLFEDQEDAKTAMTEARDAKTARYMTGPVKTWLKIGKNRYGIQGSYLPLKHYKSQPDLKRRKAEMPMASKAMNLRKLEAYQQANLEAARRILADPERYGGEEALLVQWARTILQQEEKR